MSDRSEELAQASSELLDPEQQLQPEVQPSVTTLIPRVVRLLNPQTAGSQSPAPTQSNTVTRAGSALKQLVPHVQYQLSRIGPAGQVGLGALILAAVVAASVVIPAHNDIDALRADIVHAQQAPRAAARDDGLSRVVASLPTRAQIPAIVAQVFQQAKDTGVPLDSGHYAFTAAKSGGGTARYELEFPLKASYPDIRNFINHTLAAVPAAGLAKLHIERKAVGETQVNADVNFVIFVRGE